MNPQGGNKMAEMPVRNLLLNMGAPMMISMLGQALYNVVDTFFVSHIPDTAQIADMGDKAINALTLAFPIQMLIMALGVGTGVGINAMIAKNLGRGDREQASRTAGNAMFVTLCYFVLIFFRTDLIRGFYQFTDRGHDDCGNGNDLSPHYHGVLPRHLGLYVP